jgi:hypothetical protein
MAGVCIIHVGPCQPHLVITFPTICSTVELLPGVATPVLKHDMVGLKRAYMSYFGQFQNVLKPFKIYFIHFESIYWLMHDSNFITLSHHFNASLDVMLKENR